MRDPILNKNDQALRFIRSDCLNAVRALPEGRKAIAYLQTALAILTELDKREHVRRLRNRARYLAPDPLATGRTPRERAYLRSERFRDAYDQASAHSAALSLAIYRLP